VEKAVELEQVGQLVMYLDLGLMWLVYQDAHKWGLQQVVASKMTPALGSQAVPERFGASITGSADTLRMALYRYASADAVQDPAKKA
jgi:hypothetical protein